MTSDPRLTPGGMVTLLMTDIEGSSRAWEADPTVMGSVLARHDELVDEVISAHHGHRPEQGEGDSVLAVFARASKALSAALDLQRAIKDEPWPGGHELKVRMALHSGEIEPDERGNYYGPTPNRCARVRSLAHGGQTLVTQATVELVRDKLPADVSLLDLGSHRLKDLARPERIHQLGHPELSSDFPPLLSLDYRPNNLPSRLTSFIGRRDELIHVQKLLADNRLVTLTGFGGCGKTSIALQTSIDLLDAFPDGVWWVELASLSDPALVPSAVAGALSLKEVPFQDLTDTLNQHLKEKKSLLVLDNCEHLVEALADLSLSLLNACSKLTLLATSREPLNIEGEVPLRVPSLSLPSESEPASSETLLETEACRLFLERAHPETVNLTASPKSASTIAHICRQLDGIPLAIELAASRTGSLSLNQISDGLADRFRLLAGRSRSALPRQQTLLASVEWSYQLLADDERSLLDRLAVFAGGFTLHSVEQVCSDEGIELDEIRDLVAGLVDRSLVQVEVSVGDLRYRLLETIRQYAYKRLAASGEQQRIRDRHLRFFVDLAERIEPDFQGPRVMEAVSLAAVELENFRAALDWALLVRHFEDGLRLVSALTLFWYIRGLPREGRSRHEQLLDGPEGDRGLRAKALFGHGLNSMQLFDFGAARRSGEACLAAGRATGNPWAEAAGMVLIGSCAMWAGDWSTAYPHLEEGIEIARRIDDPSLLSRGLWALGVGYGTDRGDLTRSAEVLEETLAVARLQGNMFRIGLTLAMLAIPYVFLGRFDSAAAIAREADGILEYVGVASFRAQAKLNWAAAELMRGNYRAAKDLAEEALSIAAPLQSPGVMADAHNALARVHRATGELEPASSEAEQAISFGVAAGVPFLAAMHRFTRAEIALDRKDVERADTLLQEVDEMSGDLGNPFVGGLLNVTRGRLALAQGDASGAESLIRKGLPALLESGGKGWIIDSIELLASVAVAQEQWADAIRLYGAAQAARDQIGYKRFPLQNDRYEIDLARASEILGQQKSQDISAEGAAMTMEQAIARG